MAFLKLRYYNGGLILHIVVQEFADNVIHQLSGIAVMAARNVIHVNRNARFFQCVS